MHRKKRMNLTHRDTASHATSHSLDQQKGALSAPCWRYLWRDHGCHCKHRQKGEKGRLPGRGELGLTAHCSEDRGAK